MRLRAIVCALAFAAGSAVAFGHVGSSGVPVGDFGAYWGLGFVDTALEGAWLQADVPALDSAANQSPRAWTFARQDTTYTVRSVAAVATEGPVQPSMFTARSLRIGTAMFLMFRDPTGRAGGALERYDIDGATLRAYRLDQSAVSDFLATRQPVPRNIRRDPEGAGLLGIVTLDADVVRLLSEIAADATYWRPSAEYHRQTGPVQSPNRLAVTPGSTLPPPGRPQQQVVTLFDVTQWREADRQFFIAGKGYVSVNGGGSTIAGMNRALDPFIELTIGDRRDPVLKTCRPLLTPSGQGDKAVRITGRGIYEVLPGVDGRQLVVLRLDTLSDCQLVVRR